jgi:hypothetical protein
MTTLNTNEKRVFAALYGSSGGNGHDMGIVTEGHVAGMDVKSLSGYASSLSKKGLIDIDYFETEADGTGRLFYVTSEGHRVAKQMRLPDAIEVDDEGNFVEWIYQYRTDEEIAAAGYEPALTWDQIRRAEFDAVEFDKMRPAREAYEAAAPKAEAVTSEGHDLKALAESLIVDLATQPPGEMTITREQRAKLLRVLCTVAES